ncbi:MAG: ABC transporter ATP-binding protein [Candidatus Saccharimonadales bacterium]
MKKLISETLIETAYREQPIVKLENLAKRYPDSNKGLRDINLEVNRGEVVIITGSSGSGKSTMLRIMQGIDVADEGEVTVFGHDFKRLKPRQRQKVVRDHIGITFQDPNLDKSFSVADNIILPANASNLAVDNLTLAEAAVTFGLGDALTRDASTLSGGQKMGVSLLRALVRGHKLILSDEPTAALDTLNKVAVFDAINHCVRQLGATAVIVSHDVERARAIANREIILHDGELVDTIVYER